MRALMQHEPAAIGQIAEAAGITQPAANRTVALMVKEGLVSTEPGAEDGRQRLVRLSAAARELLPRLQESWEATAAAAASLDAALSMSLSRTLELAVQALEAKSFNERITEARAKLDARGEPKRPTTRKPRR